MYSKQCKLVEVSGDPEVKLVYYAYLPAQFAENGRLITIDEFPGIKWKVEEVYNVRFPTKEVTIRSRDFTKQRRASDI